MWSSIFAIGKEDLVEDWGFRYFLSVIECERMSLSVKNGIHSVQSPSINNVVFRPTNTARLSAMYSRTP